MHALVTEPARRPWTALYVPVCCASDQSLQEDSREGEQLDRGVGGWGEGELLAFKGIW